MAANWQLWLSPRPTRRTPCADQPTVKSADGGTHIEFSRNEKGLSVLTETHSIANELVRRGGSGPPLHIHLRQTEHFHVHQGVLGVVKNGTKAAVRPSDGPVVIPPGVRHTFWAHDSGTEDLRFTVWVDPQTAELHGVDEAFMRNFTGYMRDCERDGLAPSPFQLLLFLYDGDMVMTPPFWLPVPLLKGLHHVLAYWIARDLLGYRASYPEYADTSKGK